MSAEINYRSQVIKTLPAISDAGPFRVPVAALASDFGSFQDFLSQAILVVLVSVAWTCRFNITFGDKSAAFRGR